MLVWKPFYVGEKKGAFTRPMPKHKNEKVKLRKLSNDFKGGYLENDFVFSRAGGAIGAVDAGERADLGRQRAGREKRASSQSIRLASQASHRAPQVTGRGWVVPNAGYHRVKGNHVSSIMGTAMDPTTIGAFGASGDRLIVDRQTLSNEINQKQRLAPAQVGRLRHTTQPLASGRGINIKFRSGQAHSQEGPGNHLRLASGADGMQLGGRPQPHITVPANLAQFSNFNWQGDRAQIDRRGSR